MSRPRRLGLLGGTFDPVHFGHLDAANAALRALTLDQVWLIPSHVPMHRPRDPVASPYHRFALASLAVADHPQLRVSDVELMRGGRTYTVDTLEALHTQGWTSAQLFFILGTDAFAEIATWRAYPDVLDAAHFVVITRPGTSAAAAVSRTPELASRVRTPDATQMAGNTTGILIVEADTRDVSSTTIRERLRAGRPVDDLVPTPVARHILTHQLYEAVDHLHGES
ncbi:MAG: nicotinate-nucleotide adenylyltransferase [Vicinamibacterales bacterium]